MCNDSNFGFVWTTPLFVRQKPISAPAAPLNDSITNPNNAIVDSKQNIFHAAISFSRKSQ